MAEFEKIQQSRFFQTTEKMAEVEILQRRSNRSASSSTSVSDDGDWELEDIGGSNNVVKLVARVDDFETEKKEQKGPSGFLSK
jgi:hypothetical protein